MNRPPTLSLLFALCCLSLLVLFRGGTFQPPKQSGEAEASALATSSLAVLSVFKQETTTMPEWIEHYLWQGVDHFFMIDNNSTDDPLAVLEPYIQRGLVSYSFCPEPHAQLPQMRSTYSSPEAQAYTWIINADLDEFWFATRRGSTLKSELTDPSSHFAKGDVLVAPWLMFGASGAVQQPASVRKANIHRWPAPDRFTKWIAKTSQIPAQQLQIHWREGLGRAPVHDLRDRIRLHHYPLQSREFFEKVKMARGDAVRASSDSVRTWDYWNRYDGQATQEDRTLAELLEE